MTVTMDSLLIVMILTGFFMLGSGRLAACIRTVAVQGFMVGLLPLVQSGFVPTPRLAVIAVMIVGLKAFVFPYLLSRNLRDSNISREVQPVIGYMASIIFGVAALAGSFWLDSKLDLPVGTASSLVVPVAFLMMATGLFLIVARSTAINQVLGYLVLENGIYAFGIALVGDIPILVEIGVLLDLFVAVFVMGIAICHISREFDHIDSDQLDSLKG